MSNTAIISIENVIDYIENNLEGKLGLDEVSRAVHYSKYHLHRIFTDTVGISIHDYVQRRQLTEAAKLLVFSDKTIIEIALMCGYESQQAFTSIFKEMYKLPPAEYRNNQVFYPLQLRFSLHKDIITYNFTRENIRLANHKDIPEWLALLRLVIDGYPFLDEIDYLRKLNIGINEKRALVLEDRNNLVGALVFNYSPGSIEFLGVHPQYRNCGIQKLFLDVLLETYLPEQEIYITTYRNQDKADIGQRDMLLELGFAERELMLEFGYPTQKFVLSPQNRRNK